MQYFQYSISKNIAHTIQIARLQEELTGNVKSFIQICNGWLEFQNKTCFINITPKTVKQSQCG